MSICFIGKMTRIFGEWRESNAAGRHIGTLFRNPKFILDITKEGNKHSLYIIMGWTFQVQQSVITVMDV